jgi:hypothetical protein
LSLLPRTRYDTLRALCQGALFVLCGAAILLVLTYISRPYPAMLEDWHVERDLQAARAAPGTIRALVLGNSHARESIDPMALGGGVIVFGMPFNDLAEVEYQVRTVAPELPDLEVVYLAVSYFSFHWSNDGDNILLNARRVFHALNPSWHPINRDVTSLARGKLYWVARPDRWKRVVLGKLTGRTTYEQEEDQRLALVSAPRADSVLLADAEQRTANFQGHEDRMMRREPGLPERNYRRLASTIEFLHERGVRVVLFTPPYYEPYRVEYRGRASRAEQRRLLDRVIREHRVEYYDFSEHPMGDDARWWTDSDHMNPAGRAHFTPLLVEATSAAAPTTRVAAGEQGQ